MIKLADFISTIEEGMVSVSIPVKEGRERESKYYFGAHDEIINETDIPKDAFVKYVYVGSEFQIECEPYAFPPDDPDESCEISVTLTREELSILEKISDDRNSLMPDELASKIVKDYLKNVKEADK